MRIWTSPQIQISKPNVLCVAEHETFSTRICCAEGATKLTVKKELVECCLCASVQRTPHLFFFPPFPDFPAGAADPEVEAVGSGFLWRL